MSKTNTTIPVRLLHKLEKLRSEGMINLKIDANKGQGTIEEISNELCDMLEAPKLEETEEL